MSDFIYYPPALTKEQLRQKAAQSRIEAFRRGESLAPVQPQSPTKPAITWWGKAWCANLEQYAEYRNRLGRGKSDLLSGAVIDLQISGGKITGLVQGSRRTPYLVEIAIRPLAPHRYQELVAACNRRIENLQQLACGNFPKALQQAFTDPQIGLFPAPRQIKFFCTCPDQAQFCKHVAAVLYGVGSRLDESPSLFFTLRQIEIGQLLQNSADHRLTAMIKNANRPSPRILTDCDTQKLFGV